MSIDRNKVEDRKNTEQVIFHGASISKGLKNWLDHDGAGRKIDEMLIKGASTEQLLTSGRKLSSVRSHLGHLKSEHGLPISNNGGIYKFDFPNPNIISIKPVSAKDPEHEPTLAEVFRSIVPKGKI